MAVAAEQSMTYQLVDELPGISEERQLVRKAAEYTLEQRRADIAPGDDSAELSQPIDALSTADCVLKTERVYGQGSSEHTERYNGLLLDCQRLVAEWYRKKKPEYFPPVRHVFDPNAQEFFSHGFSIRQMTENALIPMADNPEEEARRVNERVEDATPQLVRCLGGTAVRQTIRTISECADTAIVNYQEDMRHGRKHRGYGGYVPEIAKLMVRDIQLDHQTDDRLEEQIGLPGTYITHEIIQEALRRRNARVDHMDKTELHGAQLLVSDDLMEFVALLDTVASEEWCTEVFMGEEVEKGAQKDYGNFRQEALERQNGLKAMSETVATFVLDLASDSVDRSQAPAMVEEFVKKQLLELGKRSVVVAEQMFDAETAQGLQEVAYLESIGRYTQAYERMQQVEQMAPGGGYCGAGSCGIESVDVRSDEGKALVEKLRAQPGDKVVKDTERSCKCGSKSIFYAYSQRKVNKYCEACGAFESKITSPAG